MHRFYGIVVNAARASNVKMTFCSNGPSCAVKSPAAFMVNYVASLVAGNTTTNALSDNEC